MKLEKSTTKRREINKNMINQSHLLVRLVEAAINISMNNLLKCKKHRMGKYVNVELPINLNQEQSMKVIGLEMYVMGTGYKHGQMEQNMMANGVRIKHVDKECFIMLTVIYLMENGKMIKLMVTEFTLTLMELVMKVFGKMIFNMEKGKKSVI